MKKKQQSCAFRRILVLLWLLLFTGMASATDLNFGNLGWGITNGASFGQSPNYVAAVMPRISFGGSDTVFFQMPYAGNYSFKFDVSTPCASIPRLFFVGLNYTSEGTTTWVETGSYTPPGSFTHYLFNVSGYSNQGIFGIRTYCNDVPSGSTLYIYQDTSDFTFNGNADYSARSYTAGSGYTIPMVNMFYPQSTTAAFAAEPLGGSPVNANNASAYYYTPFRSSCRIGDGIDKTTVFNTGSSSFQDFFIYLNMTAMEGLVFTSLSDAPDPAPPIALNPGTAHNFSITINHPEAVTGVSWFLDGGMVSTGNAYNVRYMFNQSTTKTYNLEVFVDDTTCGRQIAAAWYINVGRLINLGGVITNSVNGLPIVPSDYLIIILNSSSLGYLSSTTTGSAGEYRFLGLSAGTYTITIGGDNFIEYSESFSLVYGSQNTTTYKKDYAITPLYSTGQWQLWALDQTSGSPPSLGITGFNLSFWWSGIKVLDVRDGVQTYKKYYDYFNTTYNGGLAIATITELPLGYTYTAKLDKVGYLSYPYLVSPSVVSKNIGFSNPHNSSVVLMVPQTTTTTTSSTLSTTTTLSPVSTTMPSLYCTGSLSSSCSQFGGQEANCNAHYVSSYGSFYQCQYQYGSCNINWGGCYGGSTTSTTTTTTLSTTTLSTTTTTSIVTTTAPTTSTTTTIWTGNITSDYHPPVPYYDCRNVTAHVYAGNWTQASWCAFVLPLGGEWAMAMVLIFVCFIAYTSTGNRAAVVLVGLLMSSVFISLYPPIFWEIIIPFLVVLGVASILYYLYKSGRGGKGITYNEGVSDDG